MKSGVEDKFTTGLGRDINRYFPTSDSTPDIDCGPYIHDHVTW